ncbi:MAG: hypothetical protein GY768_18395 [Planctomycetaceae bacterium]|nr:hypothetical protein [Planctomycetaceae bacterium]
MSWLTAVAIVVLAGCDATVRTITREAKPLAYVGQIKLGDPASQDGQILVPLEYIGGDWKKNSAIVPIDVKTTVADNQIEMTVITSVHTDTNPENGRRLVLPEASQGQYTVYYRDPDGKRHEIGDLKIVE